MTYKEDEQKFEVDIYPKIDVVLTSGKGSKVYDENGKEYLDLVAGIGVAALGHCNPKVVKAIKKQAETLITCPEIFYNDIRSRLLRKLIEITPKNLTRAFLCNSGTEANEAAIKFARISTGKQEIISATRGFHGRTLGSLSATWKKSYQQPFEPLIPGFKCVKYNDFEDLKKTINENTAAIILEVLQAEGGVYVGNKEYFQKVRRLCDEKNIILIIDEVQSGLGRTGKLFAFEHMDIVPDILTLAKPLGGGYPFAATICSDKIKIGKRLHGSTFGGNPLGCAASLAALEFIIDEGIPLKVEMLGKYLHSELRKIESDKIREIRGIGLIAGIELKEKAAPYMKKLFNKGILLMGAGPTVIRVLAPFIITKEEIDYFVRSLKEILE